MLSFTAARETRMRPPKAGKGRGELPLQSKAWCVRGGVSPTRGKEASSLREGSRTRILGRKENANYRDKTMHLTLSRVSEEERRQRIENGGEKRERGKREKTTARKPLLIFGEKLWLGRKKRC